MRALLRWVVLPALALIIAAGCNTNTNRAVSLSGKVMYKNAPVTGGTLTLFVGDSPHPIGINADGTYSAVQLPEGDAVATVNTDALNPEKPKYGGGKEGGMSPAPKDRGKGPEGKYVKLPVKYKKKDTSDLKVSLKRGKMEHTFELKD